MNRRNFIKTGAAAGSLLVTAPLFYETRQSIAVPSNVPVKDGRGEIAADVVIVGGGLGGCAAALAALRNGLSVVMTEETDWIGGQITTQGVPPDEHAWIETHGSPQSYRDFRAAVRRYYVDHYPLTDDAKARKNLNPGDGWVSRICHEPRVALAVLYEMLNPYLSVGKLAVLLEHKPVRAEIDGDEVKAVIMRNRRTNTDTVLTAPYFVDATELGDLLPLTQTEFRSGAESKKETGELHAADEADPHNQQAFTVCFALSYEKGANHTIDKPAEYGFWRDFTPQLTPPWPGKLFSLTSAKPTTLEAVTSAFQPDGEDVGNKPNLWTYRRIINQQNFKPGTYPGDTSIVNWPQNDYLLGNPDQSEAENEKHLVRAKQLSLSLVYWLQTEVPRADGGQGWPGLRLRGDVTGTDDGLAKSPYIRESRRIKALFTVLEEHVGKQQRAMMIGKPDNKAAEFHDSVGLGYYSIDLHPSTRGVNYIDVPSLPYQIPLGALLPQRVTNLLPANKNIGTTHITNGCYRLHPTEWGIGEAVGMVIFYALQKKALPRAVREDKTMLADFQSFIRLQGVETEWKS